MRLYLIKEQYNTEAAKGILSSPEDRTEAVRPILESLGGKLCHFYIAYNEDVVYLIVKLPNEESLAALLMAIKAGGTINSISATPVMTATDAVKVFKKARSIKYRPPGEQT